MKNIALVLAITYLSGVNLGGFLAEGDWHDLAISFVLIIAAIVIVHATMLNKDTDVKESDTTQAE